MGAQHGRGDGGEAQLAGFLRFVRGMLLMHECLRQVGEMLCWDNRRVIHRRDSFSGADTRLMWRTQTCGEVVLPPPLASVTQ